MKTLIYNNVKLVSLSTLLMLLSTLSILAQETLSKEELQKKMLGTWVFQSETKDGIAQNTTACKKKSTITFTDKADQVGSNYIMSEFLGCVNRSNETTYTFIGDDNDIIMCLAACNNESDESYQVITINESQMNLLWNELVFTTGNQQKSIEHIFVFKKKAL